MAALVLLAAGMAMVLGRGDRRGAAPAPGQPGVGPGPTSVRTRPAVGSSEVRVNFGAASVVVPRSWVVLLPGEVNCSNRSVVALGDRPAGNTACPSEAPAPSEPTTVSISALTPAIAARGSESPTSFNGHAGYALTGGSLAYQEEYAFPDLGVLVGATGPRRSLVLDSIDWSDRQLALAYAANHATQTPKGWKTIAYDGVMLSVPSTWPVHVLGHNELPPDACTGLGIRTNTVLEGSGNSLTHGLCRARRQPPIGRDGIWIRTARGTRLPLEDPSGPVVIIGSAPVHLGEAPRDDYLPQIQLRAVVNRTQVEITVGLGVDPTTAGQILASLIAPAHALSTTSP